MSTQNAYIESLEGTLTPEQAAQLLEMEGDTDTSLSEQAAQPDAAPNEDQDSATSEATDSDPKQDAGEDVPVDESQLTPENTVILAKDGKHTIDYQKLLDERAAKQDAQGREHHWKTAFDAAQAELESLRQQARQRADAGIAQTDMDRKVEIAQQAIDQGVDPSIFGDYSEEALAKGISEVVERRVAAHVEAELNRRLQPFEQKQRQEAGNTHVSTILAAHPDAQSIVQSKELDSWIQSQPLFVQAALGQVLEGGSAAEVIDVLDAFKKATDVPKVPQPDPQTVKDAAKKAIQAAPKPVPNSLSDIPGGRPAGQTRFERLAEIEDPHEMLEMVSELTPQQREDYMNHHL